MSAMIGGGARSFAGGALLIVSSWTLGKAALSRLEWSELHDYERVALRVTAGLGLTALMLSVAALTGWFSYTPIVLGALTAAGVGLAAADIRRARHAPPFDGHIGAAS